MIMSLSDFDSHTTEALITLVKKRPILWNKNVEKYNNRLSMHAEWSELAIILKKDKNQLKQKWRNLRDQFLRELKKMKVPKDRQGKPLKDFYRGRWIYFKDLLFLKEYMTEKKKRSPSIEEEADELTFDEIKEEYIFEDEPRSSSPIDIKEHNVVEDQPIDEPHVEVVIWPQNENQEEKRGQKRKIETDRLEQSKKGEIGEDIDEDLYFVKSLVPYLRRLNPIRKLIVRNEIQSLLIKEMLCDKCRINGPQSMCKCDGNS